MNARFSLAPIACALWAPLALSSGAQAQIIDKNIRIQTFDCSVAEDDALIDAVSIITDIRQDPARFRACMQRANLLEVDCSLGQQAARERAVNAIVSFDILEITCVEYKDPAPNVTILADANVRINGREMRVSHKLLSYPTREVAATIAHEMMHNRGGFRHVQYDFGSPGYSRTVPEQAEACVLSNRPNAGPGVFCGEDKWEPCFPDTPAGMRASAKNWVGEPRCSIAQPLSELDNVGLPDDGGFTDFQNDEAGHQDESTD